MSNPDPTPATWPEVSAWRKARRAELVARREALPADERYQCNERITEALEAAVPIAPGAVVGFCWPFKSEFDARFAVRRWRERGAVAALPEVVGKGQPLQFRAWWPGAPMRRGVYDIPFPDGTDIVVPDLAIVPMNGFDELGYRLGYGGGYFDRTLARWRDGILAIGVSYEPLRLATIYPQGHDIPMDFVVTEAGVQRAAGGRLRRLDACEAADHARRLMAARGLPRAAPYRDEGGLSSPPCYAGEFPGYFGEEPGKARS